MWGGVELNGLCLLKKAHLDGFVLQSFVSLLYFLNHTCASGLLFNLRCHWQDFCVRRISVRLDCVLQEYEPVLQSGVILAV